MSQENVEIVMGLLPAPEVDFVPLFRDDRKAASSAEAIAHLLDQEFEVAIRGMPDGEKTYAGLDGLREFWLDWLAPWTTYRQEVEEAIDLGDRVLLIIHDFGRSEGSTQEVKGETAGLWSVRDGRIARAEFYLSHAAALEALGLSEQDAHADS
jgi:ketosteroid isomerase-like protein